MVNIDAKVKDSNGDICRVEGVYDDGILVNYGGSHAEDSDFLKHGTYIVIEDIRGELEQQKQRADEFELIVKDLDNLYLGEKKRVDDLQELIERFLYSNKESDIYAIQDEEEFLNEYKQLTNK